nr:caspase family protein [uncultured Mucilaginibacter sp.]
MAKKAFIIGKNTQGLKYAESDADLLGSVLTRYFDFEVTIVKSKKEFEECFNFFLDELDVADDFLVYYSGHAQSPLGTLELLLDEKTNKFGGKIMFPELVPKIANCNARNKLVILDCCRANSGSIDFPTDNTNYRLLTASSGIGRSSELDELKAGFFTYHLCKALTKNINDVAGSNRSIGLNSIFDWLSKTTNEYNTEFNAKISRPNLMGNQDTNFEFGNLKSVISKGNSNNNIFLSVPDTEIGLAEREKFIKEANGKKNHTDWDFNIIPCAEDARLLFNLHDQEDFKRRVAGFINKANVTIKLISSDDEPDSVKNKTQTRLIAQLEQFSIVHKNINWLVNTDKDTLEYKHSAYKDISNTTMASTIVKVFEKIDDFYKGVGEDNFHPPGKKREVLFLFDLMADDDNEMKDKIKETIENKFKLPIRPFVFNAMDEEIKAIENSAATFIFYGKANPGWFYAKQENVLFRANCDCRKIVYLQPPDIEKKYKKLSLINSYYKVFKGECDIDEAFVGL